MAEKLRQLVQRLEQEQLFDKQDHEVIQAPHDEVPASSVPEAGERPDDQQVQRLTGKAAAVAAERNVEIFLEPCAQRDMPPAPEVGYGHRLIRIAEVFGEFEAEHPAETDGHVRIAGKVKVYLEGIRYRARPRHKRGNIAAERVDIRPHRAHLVCKQHLFAETDNEAHNALGEIGRCDAAVGKLILNIGITHDGACYELGEHGDVHAEVDEIFLHPDIVAINVDGVAHCLEGVKRNAYGQRDIEKVKA